MFKESFNLSEIQKTFFYSTNFRSQMFDNIVIIISCTLVFIALITCCVKMYLATDDLCPGGREIEEEEPVVDETITGTDNKSFEDEDQKMRDARLTSKEDSFEKEVCSSRRGSSLSSDSTNHGIEFNVVVSSDDVIVHRSADGDQAVSDLGTTDENVDESLVSMDDAIVAMDAIVSEMREAIVAMVEETEV